MPSGRSQILSQGSNPAYYFEFVDYDGSEGYLVRQHVIYPTLLSAIRQRVGLSSTPLMDYGAGTGGLTSTIAKSINAPVEGVDVSTNFLRLARRHYPAQTFYRSRGSAPVGAGTYNTNAHLMLHCSHQPLTVLNDIARITEANGYVFITVADPHRFKADALTKGEGIPSIVSIGDRIRMTYYPYTLETYEQLFCRAGLKIIDKKECIAKADAPGCLDKYKKQVSFVVYTLQKQLDIIDAGLVTLAGSGEILALTRSLHDDKFPGSTSLFSVRRKKKISGPRNLSSALKERVGLIPDYISPHPLATSQAAHVHQNRTQFAQVNLFAVKISDQPHMMPNEYYSRARLIKPKLLRPNGGACMQLAWSFLNPA